MSSGTATLPDAFRTAIHEVRATYKSSTSQSEVANLPLGRSLHEAPLQLRRALDLTLDSLLGTARRVAVMTGGGLDSGGLLGLVHSWAQRRGATAFAVAIDFEGPGDDRPFLRALETKLACSVVRVPPEEGGQFQAAFDEGVDGGPLTWPTVLAELAVCARAKAEGADVIMTGAWGDQLFDGEARSLAQLIREGRPWAAWQSVERLRGFSRPARPILQWLVRPFLASLAPTPLRARFARIAPIPTEPWAGPTTVKCFDKERVRRRIALRAQLRGVPTPFVSNVDRVIARYRQQIEIATGIRRIDPFLDPSLRAYCRRIPPHWLLAGDVRRGLFRESVKDLIPSVLYERQSKSGFEPALIRMVRSMGGFERLRTLSDVRFLSSIGIVSPSAFRPAFELFASNPDDGQHWPRLWPILALEAFGRAVFVEGG